MSKRIKVRPGDCNYLAKQRKESKVAGGNSMAYDKGHEGINWNSKKEKANAHS